VFGIFRHPGGRFFPRQARALGIQEGISDARDHYVAVRGLQKPQLHDDEKQEEAYRTHGDQEVLQHVPQANGAQGSEITSGFRVSQGEERPVFKTGESSNG
jgi:hypothetical protein